MERVQLTWLSTCTPTVLIFTLYQGGESTAKLAEYLYPHCTNLYSLYQGGESTANLAEYLYGHGFAGGWSWAYIHYHEAAWNADIEVRTRRKNLCYKDSVARLLTPFLFLRYLQIRVYL